MVGNGGFEADSDWTFEEDSLCPAPAAYSMSTAHGGLRSLRLGILPPTPDAQTLSAAYQAIFIPVDAVSAELSFWYKPYTEDDEWTSSSSDGPDGSGEEPVSDGARDCQEALILDASRGVLDTVFRFNSNAQTWTHITHDLTPYRGQTIYLYFNVYNNGWWERRTWMFVDDVSVNACRWVTPTPGW